MIKLSSQIEDRIQLMSLKGSKLKTPCWNWTGSLTADGHAQLTIDGKNRKVVPYLYQKLHHKNKSALVGNCLRRSPLCLSKLCVNPAHFEMRPFARKIKMKGVGKGRNPSSRPKPGWIQGEQNPHAKLTEEKVREIRKFHAKGFSTLALAETYLVSAVQINRILKRENWKHVK